MQFTHLLIYGCKSIGADLQKRDKKVTMPTLFYFKKVMLPLYTHLFNQGSTKSYHGIILRRSYTRD